MALNRYISEEIAQDCADGLMSRRDALRRLALLSLSVPAASALLAACSSDSPPAATQASSSSPSAATIGGASSSGASAAELIRFAGSSGDVTGALASAESAKAALLVIHENRGLTEHFYDLVGRFAAEGYTSLAVDLASAEGGTAALDEGAVQAALGAAPEERLVGDAQAGIAELQRRVPDAKVGVVGFCFGGGMVWNLLQAGEDRLAAAVPFYGPAPDVPDFSNAKAAVLAIYAELDGRVNASRDKAAAALQSAGLTNEIRTFPGVDHAFFNDTGARYNAAAAQEAFALVLSWFDTHLA